VLFNSDFNESKPTVVMPPAAAIISPPDRDQHSIVDVAALLTLTLGSRYLFPKGIPIMNRIPILLCLISLILLPLSLSAQEVASIEGQIATKYAKQLDAIIAHLESGNVELANAAMVEPRSLAAYLLANGGGSALANEFSHEAGETLKLLKAIKGEKGKFVPVLTSDPVYPLLLSFETSESKFSGQAFALTKDRILLVPAVTPAFPWDVSDSVNDKENKKDAQQDNAPDASGAGDF
jgi:hypothetical protein